MNPIHHLVCENERLGAVFRIQPLIAPAKAEHFFYAVGVMQLKKQRSDDIIQSGTQPSAGNNPRASVRRIEEQMFACACQLKEEGILRPRIDRANDCVWYTLRLIHPVL